MYKADDIFREDYEQLMEYCTNQSLKNARYASAILRRIFADDTPLWHVVNRPENRRFSITCKLMGDGDIADFFPKGLTSSLAFAVANIGPPDERWTGRVRDVPLSKYIEMVSYLHGNKKIKVREIIKYFANTRGGVHFGHPEPDSSDASIAELDEIFTIMNDPASVSIIFQIASQAIFSLKPLYDCVSSEIN